MNVLVTGGAGFIGCYLVDKLISMGHKAAVIDNLTSGCLENLNQAAAFYNLDIRDVRVRDIFEAEKPEIVVHLASQTNVDYSVSHPIEDASVNIIGTLNILESCRLFKTRKAIFSSSAAVYGIPDYLPIDENSPTKPISNYGISKKCAENYFEAYSLLHNINYTILRFSNVYGLRQSQNGECGVVSIFLNNLFKNEKCFIYGSGENTRDFIFVQDVADAITAAMLSGDDEIFNISSGKSISINDLHKMLCQVTNIFSEAVKLKEKEGDIPYSLLDNGKAHNMLGWQPKYSLREGLSETLSNFLKRC